LIILFSCIPLYYFWSVRPIQEDDRGVPCKNLIEKNAFHKYVEHSVGLHNCWENDTTVQPLSASEVKISSAQGIFEKRQTYPITFSAKCPNKYGYYACVIR